MNRVGRTKRMNLNKKLPQNRCIADFPEVEAVMNDEMHHGDALKGLLK